MRTRRTRVSPPRWITARFNSNCDCGAAIRKGEPAFYYPTSRTIYGSRCGCSEAVGNDYDARMFDEMVAESGHSPW